MNNEIELAQEPFFTRGYVAALCICVIVTLFVNLCIVSFAVVVGDSMLPTLETGNVLLINKTVHSYQPLDIVVVRVGREYLIKRVIGTPGDTIYITGGVVYVNGEKFQDVVSIPTEPSGIAATPITLKENEYFVLGDNRPHSRDSRYESVGVINVKQMQGKAFFSLFPFRSLGQ